MAISELFSTSFLFSIAIIIILVGGIFAYVNYRTSEQDHKLNSMLGLVSTMAEESHFFRSKLNALQHQLSVLDQQNGGKKNDEEEEQEELITVSDENDDDMSDEESEHTDATNSDETDSDETDSEDDEEYNDNTMETIKILNLSLTNNDIEEDNNIEVVSIADFNIEDINYSEGNSNTKTVYLELEQSIESENLNEAEETEIQSSQEKTNYHQDDMSFLKSLNINDLNNELVTDLGEADDDHISKNDYKKLSVNKLREVAVSKGVVNDASKLKKHEILKLLGDE